MSSGGALGWPHKTSSSYVVYISSMYILYKIIYIKVMYRGVHFKSLSQSLEQIFLTVGQNNFGNRIPFPCMQISL